MDLEIQTDFRDVDIQTDPYIPDYLLNEESRNEVLPALDVIIQQREEAREAAVDAEVERRKAAIAQKLEATKQSLAHRRGRAARATAARHPLSHPPPPSATEAAALYGAAAAPVESSALIPSNDNNRSTPYDVRPTLLNFSDGLEEVGRRAARVKMSILQPPTPAPEPAAALALTSADTTAKDEVAHERMKLLAALYRATPQLQRPSTPTLVLEGDQRDAQNNAFSVTEVEHAVVLLQSLVRGRAVQNLFYEGRLRCEGLLKELQGASSAIADEQRHALVIQSRNLQLGVHEFLEGVVGGVCGVVVSDVMEGVETLLPHLRAANELRALSAEAEEVRARREEAELARRTERVAEKHRREHLSAAVLDSVSFAAQTFLDGCFVDAAAEFAREAAGAAAEEVDGVVEGVLSTSHERARAAAAAEGEGEREAAVAAAVAVTAATAANGVDVSGCNSVEAEARRAAAVAAATEVGGVEWEVDEEEDALALAVACDIMDVLLLPQVRRRRVRVHGEPALRSRAEAEAALEAVGDAAALADEELKAR